MRVSYSGGTAVCFYNATLLVTDFVHLFMAICSPAVILEDVAHLMPQYCGAADKWGDPTGFAVGYHDQGGSEWL
jgi:hypothetical protein